MTWTQVYDPFGHWWLSALIASLPIIVLLGLLAGLRVKPHWAALTAAAIAILVAMTVFHMPASLAGESFLYGVATGLMNIVWIVVAAVFLYDISVSTGDFEIMKASVGGISSDRACNFSWSPSASAPSSKAARDSAPRWPSLAPS